MGSQTSQQQPRRRKLIDYTKHKRPDMASNRGTPRTLLKSPLLPVSMCSHTIECARSQPCLTPNDSSPIHLIESSFSTEMVDSIEFLLKIPPKASRKKSSSIEDEISRRDIFFLTIETEQQQKNLPHRGPP